MKEPILLPMGSHGNIQMNCGILSPTGRHVPTLPTSDWEQEIKFLLTRSSWAGMVTSTWPLTFINITGRVCQPCQWGICCWVLFSPWFGFINNTVCSCSLPTSPSTSSHGFIPLYRWAHRMRYYCVFSVLFPSLSHTFVSLSPSLPPHSSPPCQW